jgi:hypothetical protein
MSEATAVLESSPEVMDASRGPLVDITGDQRAEFRRTGELPKQDKPKTEEAAPSSDAKPQGEAKSAGESETPKQQEIPKAKPKQTAEERIAQLEATIEKIRKGSGIEPKPKAESASAKPEPQSVEPQYTRPKPKPEGNGPDGKPYATYEDYIEDLSDWKGEQREAKSQREAAQQAQAKEFNTKVNEARSRYENFDEVVKPTATAINTDAAIPQVIKTLLSESDVLPDILFTLGSDPAELAKFVQMAKETPGKALRYIALTESLIAEELEGKTAKPAEVSPAKPKTQAPRPPSEAGGRAAAPPDGLEAAAKANDYRSFAAEATRRQLAKLKS